MTRQRHLGIALLIVGCLTSITRAEDSVPSIQTVLINGETYVMGNHLSKRDRKHHEDEPKLKVTVRDFRIGKTKVTSSEFCEFLNSKKQAAKDVSALYYPGLIGSYNYTTVVYLPDNDIYAPKKGEQDSPANQVTWQGAMEFCQWLSEKTGKTYRLPTEAEWELAARQRADDLNMCIGIVGEWCINRWVANPEPDDMTDASPRLEDLSSERSIRGQRKWQKPPLIPFPFSNNSMHDPQPWTRQHQRPHDIENAAWYGFRIVEEIESMEMPNKAVDAIADPSDN